MTFPRKAFILLGLLASLAFKAHAQELPPDSNPIRVLLSPEMETTLTSQMVGRIAVLNASLGSAVTKGKPIVVFDCSEAKAKLQMAEAEHASALETLETKRRLRKLEAAGDMEVSLAGAVADRTKAAIAVSRAQVGQCTVPAPFSGRIVKLHVKPFQGVTVGSLLVEMVSSGPLKLRLNVPSKLLRSLRVGTAFKVDIDETGKTYPAKIAAINARVDAVAQTVEIEAQIDSSDPDLLVGMTGVAQFTSGL